MDLVKLTRGDCDVNKDLTKDKDYLQGLKQEKSPSSRAYKEHLMLWLVQLQNEVKEQVGDQKKQPHRGDSEKRPVANGEPAGAVYLSMLATELFQLPRWGDASAQWPVIIPTTTSRSEKVQL